MKNNKLFNICSVCHKELPINNYITLRSNNLQSKKCDFCKTVFIVNSPINSDNASNFYTMDAFKGKRELQDTNLYSGYYDNCFSGYDKNDLTIIQFENILSTIVNLNTVDTKKLKLLDVGCATGVFLDLARNMNFDVTGVEISNELSSYARDNFNLNVVDDIYSINNNYFDVITLNDVIEHIPSDQLNKLIVKIFNLLNDNGCLVMRTPVEDSLLRKLAKISYFSSFKKNESLLHLFYSYEHLINFSAKSLRIIGEKNGFKVIHSTREEENPNRLNINFYTKFILRVLYVFARILSLQHKCVVYYRKAI